MPKNIDKKLANILMKLDGELQMRGVRGDWGYSDRPDFCAETLTCCLRYISRLDSAPKNLLVDCAQSLIECYLTREENGIGIHSISAIAEANDANDVIFKKLLEDYRKKMVRP
jgi:hypothetical protein